MTAQAETTAGRKSALQKGLALPPAAPGQAPGYPVTDADHWEKARQAVGRVKDPKRRGQLAKLLRKTAPMFGKQEALQNSWAAPGGNGSSSNSNFGMEALLMAGGQLQCPNCGYRSDDADFSISGGSAGTSDPSAPDTLRTPANPGLQDATGFGPGQIPVQGGSPSGALSNTGQRALQFAGGSRRLPVTSAWDILVSRGQGGNAVVRHRRGGGEIGEVGKTQDGRWAGAIGGHQLPPHTQQRAAMLELLSAYNRTTTTQDRPAADLPIQRAPVQSSLMQQLGIPAVKLATPATGAGSGPRLTLANGATGKHTPWDPDGDGDDDSTPEGDTDHDYWSPNGIQLKDVPGKPMGAGRVNMANGDDSGGDSSGPAGLNPRGITIYKKLVDKGFPAARALAFARNSQNGPPGHKVAS